MRGERACFNAILGASQIHHGHRADVGFNQKVGDFFLFGKSCVLLNLHGAHQRPKHILVFLRFHFGARLNGQYKIILVESHRRGRQIIHEAPRPPK